MLAWSGRELTRWMDDFDRLAQFGFMGRDESRGSGHRGPAGLPLMRYTLSRRSLGRLTAGAALLAELLLAAGATEVATGITRRPDDGYAADPDRVATLSRRPDVDRAEDQGSEVHVYLPALQPGQKVILPVARRAEAVADVLQRRARACAYYSPEVRGASDAGRLRVTAR